MRLLASCLSRGAGDETFETLGGNRLHRLSMSTSRHLPRLFVTNAGDARIQGVEGELTFLPVASLLLNASFGYIDCEYRFGQLIRWFIKGRRAKSASA